MRSYNVDTGLTVKCAVLPDHTMLTDFFLLSKQIFLTMENIWLISQIGFGNKLYSTTPKSYISKLDVIDDD